MNRVKQLGIVLIAIALVTSAIFYPGAFTSLSADRQSTVDVVGDADAFIGLQPGDGPGGEYATDEDGRVRVALDGSITDGAGVNRGALTRVENVFTISNNGAGPVALWLENEQTGVTFEHSDEDRTIEDQENAVALEPGETIPIGILVDTLEHDLDGDDVLDDVRIVADSDTSRIPAGDDGEPSTDDNVWDDWDGEAEAQETPSEDEFFESTEEPEPAQEETGWIDRAWSGVSDGVDRVVSAGKHFADDPIGALEDGFEWASGLKDDLQSALGDAWETFESGVTTLIEDGSIDGIIDSLVDTVLDTGERAITELSDLGNLKSFLAGFVFGETGMDGGFLETSLSDSTSYLVGSIGGALTPGWGVVADTRDLLQQVANGELIESAITGAGLVLSLGSGGVNPGGALSTTQNWVGQFSDIRQVNVANSVITEVVPKLPGEQLPVRIFDQFTDGNTASQLHSAGLSDRQIAALIDSDQLSTVDPNHVERLVDEGIPPNQIVNHLEDGGDLRHLEESNRIVTDGGVPKPSEIGKGVDSKRIVDDDLTEEDLHHLAEQGTLDETHMAINPDNNRYYEGKVVWLEEGFHNSATDGGAGWRHILNRHEDDFYRKDRINSRSDIKEMIQKTINEGDAYKIPQKGDDGGTAYEYIDRNGDAYSVIVADNGFVVSSRPGKSKYSE